ncbi:MAG: hypothetical protein ACLPHP_08750 [Candidatus Sulfotelmatobacter sp.]
MSDTFASAYSKIDRAQKHIAELQALITALPEAYTATVEINPHGGNEVVKHDIRNRDELLTNIALVIGDAIHNLHCALDHAWLVVLNRLSPISVNNQTKFPIFPIRDKVEAALRGIKVNVAVPALFDFVVNQIKPYKGGDDSLWSIHSLDIDDKHRLLLPVFEFASIQGIEVENEQGEVEHGATVGTPQKPPYYVHVPIGWHFKKKGNVSVSVLFEEGEILQYAETIEMLWTFQIKTWNTVQLLDNFVLMELGRTALGGG